MRKYFVFLVYRSTLTEDQVKLSFDNKIKDIFVKYNINIIQSTYCVLQNFAYLIQKEKSGHYAIIDFSINRDFSLLKKVEQDLNDLDILLRIKIYCEKDGCTSKNFKEIIKNTKTCFDENLKAMNM